MLSNQYNIQTQQDIDNYFTSYLAGSDTSNKALVSLIIADAKNMGLDFVSYDESLTGGTRVALVIKPGEDYHWYRYNEDGTWSHKPGQTPVTNLEVLGVVGNSIEYGNIITDPKDAALKAGYTVFVGNYYIKPSESEKYE